jgi:hypothetical protein
MAITWPLKNNFTDGEVLTAANMNNIGDTVNVFNPTAATNGQVLTADGLGSASYQTAPGSMTSLVSGSLSSTSLDLQNISQAYTSLYLQMSNVAFSATNNWFLRVNNLSTDYNRQMINNTTVNNTAAASGWQLDAGNFTSSRVFNFTIYFPNYTIVRRPTAQWYVVSSDSAADGMGFGHGIRYGATAAISRITFIGAGATFTAGTYNLYGVK